jgi:hypothetical protein
MTDSEPIHRVSLSRQQTSRAIRLVCDVCATGIGSHAKWSPMTCEGCGRPVIHDTNRQPPRAVICGEPCRRIVRAANARARRRVPRACSICGVEFKPNRGDARYCSPACKQRAYRQRLVAAPPEPSALATTG